MPGRTTNARRRRSIRSAARLSARRLAARRPAWPRALLTACLLAGGGAAPAFAQPAGAIAGTASDAQGLAVPGVTVTLTGEALIAPRTAVTLGDGSYRFRALGRGTYDLTFEIPGFRTFVREGVIVEGSRAIRIDAALEVAAVAETVTVTGRPPTFDTSQAALVNDFGVEELQDVPSATDLWAALGQTAGVRMRGFDVGGSHKSQQTEFENFGIRGQHRILADGVDTTEGERGAGMYFDYYSIEEFTTTAAGADVEMNAPGSLILLTMKSGGNDFSGMVHADYEHESFVGDNVDADLEARGYTGNPNLLFFETHADLGGPIVRDRAWFYGYYNHFRIDKAVSGVDRAVATDLGDFDHLGGKVTVRLTDRDRLIGYTNSGLKQKPKRGLSADVGPDSVLAQDSWFRAHKGEWRRVWNDRTFSALAIKHWGFSWPMAPAVDPEASPPRLDAATGRLSGAGWSGGAAGASADAAGSPPFTFIASKPQAAFSMNHYVPELAGSHDLKVGYDFQVDSSRFGSNASSGHVRYLDDSENDRPRHVDRIVLYSMPAEGGIASDNRNLRHAFFVQDTWRPADRLSLNLGVRFERQRTYFLDAESRPLFADFFPTGTTEGRTNVVWNTWGPRLGVTFAPAPGTVLKGHYGRYYVNLAHAHEAANPASTAWIQYEFLDPNRNGIYDGPDELGVKLDERGATGRTPAAEGTPVDSGLTPEYADEVSFSLEHELSAGAWVRASWVRKRLNADSGAWNVPQQTALLAGRGISCAADPDWDCPAHAFTGAPLGVQRVPDDVAGVVDTRIATFPGMDATYDTVQVAVNRRFESGFFLQASFDYQWRDEFRAAAAETRDPLYADPIVVGAGGHRRIWRNHGLDVDFRQATTNWGGRVLARQTLPWGMAWSANLRYQSGWPYAPIQRVDVPGSGTNQPIFLADLSENRSDDVLLADVRVEKALAVGGGSRLTLMADVYNLFNSNAVTNFSLRTGDWRRVIAALDPIALKLGARLQF